MWDKLFKSGPSKICGKQPLKNLKGYGLLKICDWDWFYDILEVGLKKTWTNSLDSDWFYYNQAGILLEKSENLLELSVKQLVIQSRLASSISLGQAMCDVWKTKCSCCL